MSVLENKLKEIISISIKKSFDYVCNDNELMIEIPKDDNNGDYSTNIAMRLTKKLSLKPIDIANTIKNNISDSLITKVEVAGPGFINFYINPEHLSIVINNILEKNDDFGSQDEKNESILFEYVSVNPTGKLHIGHARGAAWGDTCTRLLKKVGFNVLREYYINDAGNQMINLGESIYCRYLELFNIKREIGPDGYCGEDIKVIAQIIKDKDQDKWLEESDIQKQYFIDEGLKLELEQIKEDLNYYRVEFDSYFSERSLYQSGIINEILEKIEKAGLTYKQDDALWFKSTEFNDDKDRVLQKNDGSYTYLTPDIAYHYSKFNRGYNKLVNLWGADHHGYIPRMKAAMKALGYKDEQLEVDIIQMVRIIEGEQEVKMSKRSGNAITVRELCDDIGVDAARYFILQRALDTHLDFDLSLARSKTNENPVYYIQYAHARICSILKQANKFSKQTTYKHLNEPLTMSLIKHLNEYENVIYDAAITRSPNKLCNYVYKLATYFHSYYANFKINDINNIEVSNERLNLLLAVKIVISNSLDLLGINAPEKMIKENEYE